MKRIVIFADGTWNSPEEENATHVIQMARAVKPLADGVEQIAFYDWGVGTDRKKMAGGVSGSGIDKNIMDCYRFIVHNYQLGDQLFFFGFSRGAYTVRSLAGFIRNCGLLKREHANKIPDAFKLYRQRSKDSKPSEVKATKFRSNYAVTDITPIEFVGVWDTVGALGIPVPFWGALGKKEFLFHDTQPSKIVRHARHAIAIDEVRDDFQHTPWDKKPNVDIKEVWFAGAHADVGGGYKDAGLSYCASEWMISEASQFGLQLEHHYLSKIKKKPGAKQHNSRNGIYLLRDKFVREINGPVHSSVKKRWDINAHDYRNKSQAIKKLLEKVGGDWSIIEIVD